MAGLFSDAVQREIIEEIKSHAQEQWSDIFNDVIAWHLTKRGLIQNGLYRRQQLEPASTFEWENPRIADGVPIYARQKTSDADVNLRIHKPFDKLIITNKASYMGSEITTEIPENDALMAIYDEFETINTMQTVSERLVRDACGFGSGYALLWNDGQNARVKKAHPWECLVVYDENTEKAVYGFRYWPVVEIINGNEERSKIRLDFYDGLNVYHFITTGDNITAYRSLVSVEGKFLPYEIDGETWRPHSFGTVENEGIPLIEFPNSEGRLGDVELSIDMQDAYDVGVSDISSELSQMAHAFLVQEPAASSGVIEYNDVDDDFKEQVKKTGVLLGNWKFLTKDINAQAENENLARLKHDIFQASMSYDPDELSGSSGQAMTAFQIERKLTGLEQSSKDTETEFNAAFYRMDERLSVYFREFKNSGDYDLSEIDRSFPRNIPQNELQNLKDAVASGIRISQRNKLALAFPTIDYDQNKEQLEEDAAEGVEALTSEAFGDGSQE